MAESSHTEDKLSRVEERVKCFLCSNRFVDPRLLSCHHTFCKACLRRSVINDSVTCPKCRTVHNLSADGVFEGLPSSLVIIHLLEVINKREWISLAIRERHSRDRNRHYRMPDIAMVTPSMPGYAERHGGIAVVTPSMPGYAERCGTVFIDRDVFLGGQPRCIAVSPAADRLYVTVHYPHTVLIVDDCGKLMKTAYGADVGPGANPRDGKLGFDRPDGIAVNKDGDVIVSDSGNHRVVILSRDGEYQFSFGTHGENDGQFDWPCGMAVDDACSIYVCDLHNHRVQVFTRYGKYLRTFVKPDNVSGAFSPTYLAIARTTNRVYVTDWLNHRVYVDTLLGRCITCFGTEGHGEGEMSHPHGICVDDDGRVLIADRDNDRVHVFNSDGTYHCTLVLAHDIPPLSRPVGLTIDRTGCVFVVDRNNDRIIVF